MAMRCLEGEPGVDVEAVRRVVAMTQPGSGAERAGSPAAPVAATGVSAARATAASPTVEERLEALELQVSLLMSVAAGEGR